MSSNLLQLAEHVTLQKCGLGARAYMEDRHTVIASYSPSADGISRSFAAVYDGHNGARAAEHCSSRWV